MKISYDSEVNALYIRLVEGKIACEVIQLNDRIAINIGPYGQIVGIEVLDASELMSKAGEIRVHLESVAAA
ncbi:MAG: DUF2283 domain-containing protein [Archaeoglobaceae archaeon]